MLDKNLFIQDLKSVYTVLQELRVIEKYVKESIENNNLTEEKVLEVNNKLLEIEESFNIYEEVKDYVDGIKNYIIQNDNTTEIGGNVEIDGKLDVNSESTFNSNVEIKAPLKTTSSTEFNGTNTFNNDVTITGEMYLPTASSLIFEDGSSVGVSKLYRHTFTLYDEEGITEVLFTFVSSKNKDDFSSNFEFATNVFYYGAIGSQMSSSPNKIWFVGDIGSSYIDISSFDGSGNMSFDKNNFTANITTKEI